MGKHGLKSDNMAVSLVTGLLALLSVAFGFLAGMVLAYLMKWNRERRQKGNRLAPHR